MVPPYAIRIAGKKPRTPSPSEVDIYWPIQVFVRKFETLTKAAREGKEPPPNTPVGDWNVALMVEVTPPALEDLTAFKEKLGELLDCNLSWQQK